MSKKIVVNTPMRQKINELQVENERLREVLSQYADHNNWGYVVENTFDIWLPFENGWMVAEKALGGYPLHCGAHEPTGEDIWFDDMGRPVEGSMFEDRTVDDVSRS